ncbi:hypothetical protein A0H81_01276 [Grifola frondosa]|uniref:Uncharacterized protein n=1 Tax=Grifola frondosa TaxID=5627 RepID=A0A1C7MP35_GRIFR|nr:hypothetical protein A0H81_01276 [Grifola frondosa]
MFRVSPWITYDPSPDARNEPLVRSNIHFYSMNEDVEMDAPQISTLREESTPEPQPTRTKFRVKLLVNDRKHAGSRASSVSRKLAQGDSDEEEEEDEEDEEEEEEDQLIDDDDDEVKSTTTTATLPATAPPIRGSPAKRGRGRGGGRRKTGRGGAPDPHAVLMATTERFDAGSSEAFTTKLPKLPQTEVLEVSPTTQSSSLSVLLPGKKKATPAKGATAQRAIRKKPSKVAKPTVVPPRDDAESISEAYPGTAASSPMPHDDHTPEPDITIPAVPALPHLEDGVLEGVPLPVYPLPSKPFPVQPPPKIGSGFAPIIPLDRSGKPVRRWRQVNREVRGIAGGRWFARTWVGEKESEFASAVSQHVESASATGSVALPKLSALSVGPGKIVKPRGSKADLTSATVSRSASLIPETGQTSRKRNAIARGTPTADIPIAPLPTHAPPQ